VAGLRFGYFLRFGGFGLPFLIGSGGSRISHGALITHMPGAISFDSPSLTSSSVSIQLPGIVVVCGDFRERLGFTGLSFLSWRPSTELLAIDFCPVAQDNHIILARMRDWKSRHREK
jgi:hypothetical protein